MRGEITGARRWKEKGMWSRGEAGDEMLRGGTKMKRVDVGRRNDERKRRRRGGGGIF